jgi:hypothetical protein
MTSENSSPAIELDSAFQTAYALVIEQGENANRENLNFILDTAELLNSKKISQEVAIASMKATAKDVKIGVVVKHGHVPALTITAQIILKFASEMDSQSASKMLTLGSRVLADKKAKGAKAHINSFETVAELDENTLSKAEATARDKGVEIVETVQELAQGITLESMIDGVDAYLGENDLATLTTSELVKLNSVIARLITVAKNTKALVK